MFVPVRLTWLCGLSPDLDRLADMDRTGQRRLGRQGDGLDKDWNGVVWQTGRGVDWSGRSRPGGRGIVGQGDGLHCRHGWLEVEGWVRLTWLTREFGTAD
jgi:hypothetical protein